MGRTGTFITLHSMLLRIKAENNVDVFGFVSAMRRRRCYMEFLDQYEQCSQTPNDGWTESMILTDRAFITVMPAHSSTAPGPLIPG